MISLVKKLDFFARKPTLYFGQEESHQTLLGSILSFSIMVLIAIFTYIFGQELVERKYPQVIRAQYQSDTNPIFNINSSNLPLAFGLMDPYLGEPIYDEKLFSFRINVFGTRRYNENGIPKIDYIESKSVKSEKCNINTHKIHDLIENQENLKIENLHCLPIVENLYQFGGSIFYESYYLMVDLVLCDKTKYDCHTDQYIQKVMERGIINAFFPRVNVDPSKENPIVKVFKPSWTYYDQEQPQIINLLFNTAEIQIDKGLVFQDIQKTNLIGFTEMREINADLTLQKSQIRFMFETTQTTQKITLTYKKFQQVVAEIGGFFNALLFIGLAIVYLFREIEYYNHFIKSLYQLQVIQSKEQKPLQTQEIQNHSGLSIKQIPAKQSIELVELFINDSNPSIQDQQYENGDVPIPKKISINTFEKFRIMIGLQGSDQRSCLFQIAQEEIEQKIDIINIIQRLDQVERMQHLLLSEEQLILFQNYQKPQLCFLKSLEMEEQQQFRKQSLMSQYYCINDENLSELKNPQKAIQQCYFSLLHEINLKQVVKRNYYQELNLKILKKIKNGEIQIEQT